MSDDPREYVESLKHRHKREYAASFYDYLTNGGREPDRPAGLSFFAAQNIRFELARRFFILLLQRRVTEAA